MSGASAVQFHRFDRAGARERRDIVALIHRDAYAAGNASRDAFASDSAFMQRFDAYTSRSEFDLVIAYHGSEPIGQTWGWALGPNTALWDGLTTEPEPGFTIEDGHRTFALSEIMVRQDWTGPDKASPTRSMTNCCCAAARRAQPCLSGRRTPQPIGHTRDGAGAWWGYCARTGLTRH